MKLVPEQLQPLAWLALPHTVKTVQQEDLSHCGVLVTPLSEKRASFTVMNGHQLLSAIQVKDQPLEDFPAYAPEASSDNAAIIPAAEWINMFRGIPKSVRLRRSAPIVKNVALSVRQDYAEAATTDLEEWNVTAITPLNTTFPDYQKAIRTDRGKATIYVDAHLLRQVVDTLSQLMRDVPHAAVRLDIYDEVEPIRLSALVEDTGIYYSGAVMPMKAHEIPLTPPGSAEEPAGQSYTGLSQQS